MTEASKTLTEHLAGGTKPRCDQCAFWSDELNLKDQPDVGICYRYPPTRVLDQAMALRTMSRAGSWCGEFLPRPN